MLSQQAAPARARTRDAPKDEGDFLRRCRELGIEWRNPGPEPPSKTRYTDVLALVRERSGTWAMIQRFSDYSNATAAARRMTKVYPAFEFCARPLDDLDRKGPGEVFARSRRLKE